MKLGLISVSVCENPETGGVQSFSQGPVGSASDVSVCPQVNIQVPAPDQQSDKIAITGLANNLERAKDGLLERVKELQAEQEDRVSPVRRSGSSQTALGF